MKKNFQKHFFYLSISLFVFGFLTISFGLFEPSASIAGGEELVVYLGTDKGKSKLVAKEFKSIKKDFSDYGVIVIDSSEENLAKTKKLNKEIISYSENKTYRTTGVPNDTLYGEQWSLPKISAPNAWDSTTGSNNISVAVLDTGFNLNHEDLSGKFTEARYDAIDEDMDPSLPVGGGSAVSHATFVSGIIAATTNNNIGVSGIDWNTKIMPVRVMDNNGVGTTATIAAGINYAVTNGAKVINMSLGYDYYLGPDSLEVVINNAYGNGVTLVAAAGNSGDDSDPTLRRTNYPAAYENVIAVGATDMADTRASYSCYGPELDVVAPGSNVFSATTSWNGSSYTNTSYGSGSGTSFATPYVSGLSSLVLATGDFSPLEIKNKILGGADKVDGMLGQDTTDYYGFGRINANNAILEAGQLHHINISPSINQTLVLGQTIQFDALGQDIANNDIEGLIYTWTGANQSGFFSASQSGTFDIRAVSGGVASQIVRITVIDVTPASFVITKGLYLSDVNPTVGSTVYGKYEIKNVTGATITLDLALVDYAEDAKVWNSYAYKRVTIAPNTTGTFTGTHIVKGQGLHHTWLAFSYNGRAYNFNNVQGQLSDFWYKV